MKGGGGFGWEPGEWTDDTQMAVAVLDAAEASLLDMDGVAANFLAWFQSGPPDVGNQTRSVLGSTVDSADLAACSAAYLDAHPRGAGNGGLMRTSPVADRFNCAICCSAGAACASACAGNTVEPKRATVRNAVRIIIALPVCV